MELQWSEFRWKEFLPAPITREKTIFPCTICLFFGSSFAFPVDVMLGYLLCLMFVYHRVGSPTRLYCIVRAVTFSTRIYIFSFFSVSKDALCPTLNAINLRQKSPSHNTIGMCHSRYNWSYGRVGIHVGSRGTRKMWLELEQELGFFVK